MASSSKDKEKQHSSKEHKERRKDDGEESSSRHRDKHRKERGRDEEKRHHRPDKHASSSSSSSKRKDRSGNAGQKIIDDNPDDEGELWVEKAADEEPPSIANIPTCESLKLTSHAQAGPTDPPLPKAVAAESQPRERRDEWMLDDQTTARKANPNVMRQSDNLTNGGTFSLGEIPSGIARPNAHDTVEAFTDGYGEGDVGTKGTFGGDCFSAMGQERKRKEVEKKQPIAAPKMSSREINKALFAEDGNRLDSSVQAIAGSTSGSGSGQAPPTPGSSGSNWRMMKLRRVYETAEEEKRTVEDVGLERFGTIEAWEAALEERRVLDGKPSRPVMGRAAPTSGDPEVDEFGREIRKEGTPQPQTRYIFNEPGSAGSSRPPSRASSFRRPGSAPDDAGPSSRPQTPQPSHANQRTSKLSTPIPSVFTPPVGLARKQSQLQTSTTADDITKSAVQDSQSNEHLLSKPPMSPTSLNRLQAKVLRMRLMGGDAEELKELEATYENELQRSRQGDAGGGYFSAASAEGQDTEVRVLPTLDGRGRLYDVGTGKEKNEGPVGPGNKRKRKEAKFETRDSKTGELLRINADDDTVTLEELLREERFGGGAADQKNMDAEIAARIAGDGAFRDNLDYLDESAERLARKKVKTEAQKKMFAIQDYAKTKKALDTCQFCYQDTDTATVPPQACMVALGTRAYLSLPLTEPLVDGHAIIVPTQHHLSSLEADDDTWDEIKNFMKTLMQMHADEDKGVLFYETVTSFKGQRHTYIEAVPVPWEFFEQMPGYFHEGIQMSEAEWAQHQKLIDFSKRPGGFRRAMVPNLPYFMVQWDYKGEKGYGHVIEGAETATGEGDTYDFDEGAKGGGEFPRNFAAEIIGNVLDLEPRKWRKPRRMDRKLNEERIKAFRKHYDKFDWTKMLSQTSDA